MAFAVLAARIAFAMPGDLQANWIFRVVPGLGAEAYARARRRALLLLAVAPVWIGWAIGFLWLCPWRPAIAHLLVLAFLGMTLIEIALMGPLKIPCTCSYLPGRSHVHLAFCAMTLLLIGLILRGARFELDALQNLTRYILLLGVLAATWLVARWVVVGTAGSEPMFDEAEASEAITLGVWDSRIRRIAPLLGRVMKTGR